MEAKKILPISTLLMGVFIVFQSCEKEENETNISSYYETESHHTGENCMDCHTSGEKGEGWFSVAGTVNDNVKTSPLPNGTVRLFTGPQGTGSLELTIEVDGLGNFYTTENIDFGDGLYTSVEGNTVTKHMNSVISTGQCNSCHGVSTDVIWAK